MQVRNKANTVPHTEEFPVRSRADDRRYAQQSGKMPRRGELPRKASRHTRPI
jgi:hypothetical protein